MSPSVPTPHKPGRLARALPSGLAYALLALSSLGGAGCPPPPLEEQMSTTLEDQPLDPQTLFETRVKPEVSASCSCHYTQQITIAPFLGTGTEYSAITGYGTGKFLTAVPDESLLLLKGAHTGPAFTAEQATTVRGWLSAEAATRGGNMSSPTTPTVPLRVGDFFMSLQALTQDPLASITFKLAQVAGTTYRISELKVNAGPSGGIQLKHPRFIIFTAAGATPEASDGLSTVDLTVTADTSVPLGSGSLLLTDLPATSARIALAFQVITVVNPMPVNLACKNFAAFDPPVKNQLGTCAAICHSPTGSDPRRAQATGAFNMAAALSSDPAMIAQLCLNAKARIDKVNPDKSILVVQAQTAATGGTVNHPYKISDPTQFSTYKNAIVTWASGEK